MYEALETELGIQLPCALKYKDPFGIHAALLISDKTGEVLAYGINKHICSKTMPHGKSRYTIHAEQELLRNYTKTPKNRNRGQKTLVSLRFTHNGVCGNSKICVSCADMILNKFDGMIRTIKYMDASKTWQEASAKQIREIAVTSSGDKRTIPISE